MAVVKKASSLGKIPEGISLSSSSHYPTPSEFDRFIPWVVLRADVPERVEVSRLTIDEDSSKKIKKQSTKALSRRAFSQLSQVNEARGNSKTCPKWSAGSDETKSGQSKAKKVTKISAFYTSNGQLTEIAFIKCQLPVPIIVLDAIHLCLAHHPHLTRITWNGNYLTGTIICEISKMLIGSFLTDVILDNSCAPEKNYYVLLNSANLKYLSLRSCGVNDEACEKIAEGIQRHRPGENLVALNLAVNFITDKGAKALGHALRTNRRLSLLNLCCNSITSDGAAHILLPLIKFPLNPDEIMDVKKKKFELAKHKIEIKVANKTCLGDITNLNKTAEKKKRKSVKNVNTLKEQDQTEKSTDSKGMGADGDIFMSNLEVSSGVWFSLGNVTLCSLNLAYNRLDYMAVSKIADVLAYQYREDRGPKSGLIRVVIEGNLLSKDCPKYNLIDNYMKSALSFVPTDMTENVGKSIKSSRSLHKSKSR